MINHHKTHETHHISPICWGYHCWPDPDMIIVVNQRVLDLMCQFLRLRNSAQIEEDQLLTPEHETRGGSMSSWALW